MTHAAPRPTAVSRLNEKIRLLNSAVRRAVVLLIISRRIQRAGCLQYISYGGTDGAESYRNPERVVERYALRRAGAGVRPVYGKAKEKTEMNQNTFSNMVTTDFLVRAYDY